MKFLLVCVVVLFMAAVAVVDVVVKETTIEVTRKLRPDTANCVITGDWTK